jgi:hypothetical protein
MSHAAPTPCMNVPTSEAMSAKSKSRKIGVRNGRHRLRVGCLRDVGIVRSASYAEDNLTQNDDHECPEPFDQGIGRSHAAAQAESGPPHQQ